MGKDPAFLFYPNDWIGGTMGMTFEEKGAYMELLMMQFNRGHMTSDMIGQTVGQLWVKIQDKFEKDSSGKFFNRRLEEEQEKRKDFTLSRRNNLEGKNQYTKSKKKVGHMEGHMSSHMENENENEDSIKNDDKKDKLSNDEKRQQMERRRTSFAQQVLSKKEYPQDMLMAFFDYWSEATKSGIKMRYELQPTWELDRRLKTWNNRSNKTSSKKQFHGSDFEDN